MKTPLVRTIKTILATFDNFTSRGAGIRMWFYQLEPAQAILHSIFNNLGLTIVLVISRQAGKDELLANLLTYILTLFSHRESSIVVVNPTYKPQTDNAIMRLENRLNTNLLTKSSWRKRGAYIRRIGKAIATFLSAEKGAKIVGATASKLLIGNEAQDIEVAKWDKDIAPMGTYHNPTRLIVGTEWTNQGLLAREEDAAKELEKQDNIKRVFRYTADDVRIVNKAYGLYVDEQIRKLGRQHPLVKTQFFCERIDAVAGMFPARRLALMQGDQSEQETPIPGHIYAFLIDVAGQDEATLELEGLTNPGRDKTTLRIIDVDLSSIELLQKPIYRAVARADWHGENHVQIFGALCALTDIWNPLHIVEDATGAGEGLAGMLAHKYPTRFIPFKFTAQSKSEMGYQFLAIIESGRFHDCCQTEEIREQYQNCTSEILVGPQHLMRWGVKDGTRAGDDKHLVHDDYITTDALTSELDKLEWYISSETTVIEQQDIIKQMDRNY